MRIIPDYSKQHKCYYCNHNDADPELGYNYNIYCIAKTRVLSYNYITVKVEVPRCKDCEKRHSRSALPALFFFIALFVIALIKGIIPQWGDNSIWENLLLILLMLFLSFAGGSILGLLPGKIIMSILKVKFDDDVDEYNPIKRLLNIGFRKNKPKPHTHPDAVFNNELYNKTINEIITYDKCKIEK